jgi:quercetin dioxygenase-like cupin family protein
MNTIKVAGLAACVVAIGSCIAVAVAQSGAGADGTQFARITPDTVKWVDYPGDGAQFGIKEAFIYGDPTKPGLYVIRLKFPPGVMSRPHSHPETRIGTVIKGTWWTGTGEKFDPSSTTAVPTGGIMVHPAGKVHYDGARNEETIVQMMGIGPTGKKTAVPGDPGFSKQ